MKFKNTPIRKFFYLLIFLLSSKVFSQATIKVTITSVQTSSSVDCDNAFFDVTGQSEFVWEYTATDNTLGYSNNAPALFGVYDFNYTNAPSSNGPINITPNSVFFDHQYICPSDVPDTINLAWEAYENDDPNEDILFFVTPYENFGNTDAPTGIQNVQLIVPSFNGISDTTFSAVGTSGCPNPVTYTINVQIERINLSFELMEDNICDAVNIPVDNSTHTYALCNSLTIEPNEPIFPSLETDTRGSAWFYFTLPANSSGNIRIDTDLPETNFTTEIALYHAADGFGCIQGTNSFNSLQVKNKFNYLSEHSNADDDIFGIEFNATGNWNGTPLISEGDPLIPGETYYIQFNSDASNQQGSVGFRITDLGGTPTSFNDIPCKSTILPGSIPTTTISSENTNAGSPNLTLNYSNATDRETGAIFSDNNAENYVAYLYSEPAGTTNSIDENVWFNFTAPNSGRVYFEGEVTGLLGISEAEDIALFGLDERFAPGQPTDLFCSNLSQIDASAGSVSGSNRTAKINATCLEPGYTYYGMLDPQSVSLVSNGKIWLYDPSVTDPSFNAPGNDILCIAMQDTLYKVPVILAGTNPTFQAVAGSNVRSCREYLAGEPAANSNENLRADQTVWHYFEAPPSGAIEMSIRAYVGMDTLRYNVFELLNDSCYGGLRPATYTEDGTQSTQLIQPIISGTAGYSGSQKSACCLTPGKIYAIQIDGGSPGDEGQYIIEYIKEVDSDAGDIYVQLANGDSLTIAQQDTVFICYGDVYTPGITVNAIGQSSQNLPDCLIPGYVLHPNPNLPDPIANTGFSSAYIDTLIGLNGSFTHNGDGSGNFGNPYHNLVYYLSPAGDISTNWGSFTCGTSTVEEGIPIVFLDSLSVDSDYNNNNCTVTFTASGGLNVYNGQPYAYTILNPSLAVVETGNFFPGAFVNYTGGLNGIYTVEINDGACTKTFTFDATTCGNPCIPSSVNVNLSICQGESILLGGALQTESGFYTDVFVTSQGCDSTVLTILSINPVETISKQHNLCPGGSIQIGNSIYNSQGVFVDTLQTISGCDSIVTSIIFMQPTITTNTNLTICSGTTYDFNGTVLSNEGVYSSTLATSEGCDSVVVLSLFVTPPNSNYEVAEICIGESFTYGNQTFTESGIYKDTIQTATGCDSLSILELSVLDCEFQISNILTPNDDGQNDTWRVSDLTKILDCKVTIYNRWGEPVFETTNYQNDWGGTREGEPLPDGVYFYAIKCSNQEYTGSINLLRFKK